MHTLGVIGAGAFGTALAVAVAERWKKVRLYSDLHTVAEEINCAHRNTQFLPGVELPAHFTGYASLQDISTCSLLFLAVPAQVTRRVCEELKKQDLPRTTPLVICSKGIELTSGLLLSEVVASLLPNPLYVLSGPSFAKELARHLPTAVSLAGEDAKKVEEIKSALETPSLGIDQSTDLIGTQLGGVLKNVLAVGAGLVLGSGSGENARAVLIAKGFQEMMQIAEALGGKGSSLFGMSGIGDMILTCMSTTSRNTTFGMHVARGEISTPLQQPFAGPLAEGALTAAVLPKLKERVPHLATPLFSKVHDILYAGQAPESLIGVLLS